MLAHFSLIISDFQGSLYLVLDLVGIHLAAVSMFAETNYS